MKYFSLSEFTTSDAAIRHQIDNSPGPSEINNIRHLVKHVLDPLRDDVDSPIIITSGYRCPRLNKFIGGSKNSQHCMGQAADIKAMGISPAELIKVIFLMEYPVDQCILEFGRWVHVSHVRNRGMNRGQFLVAVKAGKRTEYLHWKPNA